MPDLNRFVRRLVSLNDGLSASFDARSLEMIHLQERNRSLFHGLNGVGVCVDINFHRLIFLKQMLNRRKVFSMVLGLKLLFDFVNLRVDIIETAAA